MVMTSTPTLIHVSNFKLQIQILEQVSGDEMAGIGCGKSLRG